MAHSHFGLPASATSSLMALIATCICSWPNITAPSMTSSSRPLASDSTIRTPSSVPATTRSSFDCANCEVVGLRTYLPSRWPTRAAPIGPMNGMPEIASAAEAPINEAISGSTSAFTDITEATTCTSLVNPSGNSGRIGLSIRREVRVSFSVGRPTEKETLTSRLIDRPIRPLFPDGFTNDVQVVASVISVNAEVDPDIASLIGASAALAISGMPFMGPIGAARVGHLDGKYVLNPTTSQLAQSKLDLVVAGTEEGVLMVESEASGLDEEVMLGAVMFGHEQMQVAIKAIKELVAEAGKPKWVWAMPLEIGDLKKAVSSFAEKDLAAAYAVTEKQKRHTRIGEIKNALLEALTSGEHPKFTKEEVGTEFFNLEHRLVRERILDGHPRIDGRDTKTVRAISIRTGVLARTHGSALFTRGETQALVVTTLGTGRDAQIIDGLTGERKEPFMLHYNFPPFSVGETGMMGSPKRREIGHGNLAKRGVKAVMPGAERFPYVIRVVSEILESNGSSSMASVCGTSLALMDAGVPIKAPVAGVAMGLVKEGARFKVLTDILGDEDHLGD